MIITKMLLKDKMRKDGYCPVVIRISHNDKFSEINTAVFAKSEDWDADLCRLTDSDIDCRAKNLQIDSIYRRISGQIQSFIDSVLDENFDSLLTPYYIERSNISSKKHFSDLVKNKVESCVSYNTRRGYESFGRYVARRMQEDPAADDINQNFTNKFIETINEDYKDKESMRRFMFSRFNAVINMAKDSGDICKAAKIALPHHSTLPTVRNLSNEEISCIFDAYKERIISDPEISSCVTKALGLFVLDIAFQGLAPVDLANLKIKSIEYKTLHHYEKNFRRYKEDADYRRIYDSMENNMRIVAVNTMRKKTGRPVEVISSIIGIYPFLRKLTDGKSPDDYLLDCFDPNKNYSMSQRQNRLANYFNRKAKYLNQGIEEYYRKHGLGKPCRVTYYFARHAFCNLANGMDVPKHIIQMMVGHRSSVLEASYLRPITHWEQAELSQKLLGSYFDR